MARITVDDCLEYERNRFSLVLLASRRAKAILNGRTPVVDTRGNKAVVSSLREIAAGQVRFSYGDDGVSSLAIPSESGKSYEASSFVENSPGSDVEETQEADAQEPSAH